jgi:hypothetical protein
MWLSSLEAPGGDHAPARNKWCQRKRGEATRRRVANLTCPQSRLLCCVLRQMTLNSYVLGQLPFIQARHPHVQSGRIFCSFANVRGWQRRGRETRSRLWEIATRTQKSFNLEIRVSAAPDVASPACRCIRKKKFHLTSLTATYTHLIVTVIVANSQAYIT